MATRTINAEMLAKMFLAGAGNIEAKKEIINELNVFPVPDGDTGTNMSLTIMAAAKEVTALQNPSMEVLAKAISSGSLRGARGNSGVILSQLFRGFTKAIREQDEIDVLTLANACVKAKETAYKAVMKPKEGTILTVARGIADKAVELSATVEDLEEFIPQVIAHAEEVLAQTPEMLPVLKEAGVVDSGGQGLIEVLKGAYDAFLGKEIDYSQIAPSVSVSPTKISAETNAEIKFGYCTEFIIMTEKEFYTMCEKLEDAKLPSGMGAYYPTAEELVESIKNIPLEELMPVLLFYASDPFKDLITDENYRKTVKCAKKLSSDINLS